ncbi:ENO3, partial [Symbiodinium sp. KB8]
MSEERKEIEEYLDKHSLEKRLNIAINKTIKERSEFPLYSLAHLLLQYDAKARGIIEVSAREVLDSRGFPTLEVTAVTPLGRFTAFASNFAAVKGEREPRYDGVSARYEGKGVAKAVNSVMEIISPALSGMDPTDQKAVDEKLKALDGTVELSVLGVNTINAVSMAVCKAGAAAAGVPLYKHIANLCNHSDVCLPVPVFNALNGGTRAPSKLMFE